MTEQLKRGEVWLANLNPTQGSQQAGTRPVIFTPFPNYAPLNQTPVSPWGTEKR
ncbi:type II toxin-antitoxin system PemK/MazF family toxin [Microseira sp. BLCC-F43]|jgi:mRNA interferase MazF|uniref:type II toxin-antitoxin system PemK/MazF family toxin n=1 Tax=Microseira sp. BLCC-F43 TaxID=3153602 RepID=UPI0035B8D6AE